MIGPIMGGGRPLLKWNPATVNVIADGNSFFAGPYYVPAIASRAPLSGRFNITNVAVGGQTYRMMNGLDDGSATDVDAAYVPGKTNVLLICEGTNAIALGRTGLQAAQDAADYIAARRAAMPGVLIAICTTIPRQTANSDAVTAALNQQLLAHDAYLRANFKAMGAHVLVDVRPGTRFDFVADTNAAFDAVKDLLPEYYSLHPNEAGCNILAAKWEAALSRMPAR